MNIFLALSKGEHSNVYLQNAFNKYNRKVFKFEVLQKINNSGNLLMFEQDWIDKFKSFGTGYNLRPQTANNLGFKFTKAQSERLSKAQKGISRNKGKVVSLETRKKMSETKKKRKASYNYKGKKGKDNPMYGVKASEETKKKISEALKGHVAWNKGIPATEEHKTNVSKALLKNPPNKGKPMLEETKLKLSRINTGKICSEETRKKMKESSKGRIPKNLSEFVKKYSGSNSFNSTSKAISKASQGLRKYWSLKRGIKLNKEVSL